MCLPLGTGIEFDFLATVSHPNEGIQLGNIAGW
jgi:hypothetical protein